MDEPLTLENIKSTVESTYPNPVAAVFRKCRTTSQDDLGSRYNNLKDLFEIFLKLTCVIALQDARNSTPNLRDLLPQKEKTLEFLKRPSIGGWMGLLRVLCNLQPLKVAPIWLSQITEWYNAPKSKESGEILALFSEFGGVNYQKKSKTPNAEICNALVTYRNKYWGHGANLDKEILQPVVPLLETILAYLLQSASFLSNILVFHTQRVEATEDKKWKLTIDRLIGASSEPGKLLHDKQVNLKEMFATQLQDVKDERKIVPLTPFLIWHQNESFHRQEAYFHNDTKRTYLEYLSYFSGDHYYHKELHSDFEKLLHLKPFDTQTEEVIDYSLTPEQRADIAERHSKQAALHRARGRLEEALKEYETSVIFERRPESYVKMAELEKELGDSPESVRITLQHCFDVDPDNEKALSLLRLLDTPNEDSKDVSAQDTEFETCSSIPTPTVYHAFTPQAFRQFAPLWWVIILLGWYSFSAGIECLIGHPNKIVIALLQYPLALSGICLVIVARSIVLRMRLPLSLQLDTMRLGRFEKWFDRQVELMFGKFIFQAGRLKILQALEKEHWFYLGSIPWTIILASSIFALTHSYGLGFWIGVIRFIDFCIIYFLLYLGCRYVLMSTLFVYEFSRLSLKPVLTRIGKEGIRSFGPLMCFNIIIASIAFTLHWTMASRFETANYYFDFVFVAFNASIMMIWSVGMPLMLRRTMQEAKAKSIQKYSEHIENAYNIFMEDPGEKHLERYQWLYSQQKVIKRISHWPLSLSETIVAVIGGNLIMISVSLWYVLFRMGKLSQILERVFNCF